MRNMHLHTWVENMHKHNHALAELIYTHTLRCTYSNKWAIMVAWIFRGTQRRSISSVCVGMWQRCVTGTFSCFLFWSSVEGIMALVIHLRKVMPCSITLNSAKWTRAPAYVCLRRECIGLPVGMWRNVSTSNHSFLYPPHTQSHRTVTKCCLLKYPLIMFPLFLYSSWFSETDRGSHTLHPVLHWHTHTDFITVL